MRKIISPNMRALQHRHQRQHSIYDLQTQYLEQDNITMRHRPKRYYWTVHSLEAYVAKGTYNPP